MNDPVERNREWARQLAVANRTRAGMMGTDGFTIRGYSLALKSELALTVALYNGGMES
jgi:hypothetical protein